MLFRRHHEEEEREQDFNDEPQRDCYDFDAVEVLVKDAFYLAERKRKYSEANSDTRIDLERVVHELQKTIERSTREKSGNEKTKCGQLWETAKTEGVRGYLIGVDKSKTTLYSDSLVVSVEQFVVLDDKIMVISHMNRNDFHCYDSKKKELSFYPEKYETVDHFVETLLKDRLQYYVVRINEKGNISDTIRYEHSTITDPKYRFKESFKQLIKQS